MIARRMLGVSHIHFVGVVSHLDQLAIRAVLQVKTMMYSKRRTDQQMNDQTWRIDQ
jgi:hypothetical protein